MGSMHGVGAYPSDRCRQFIGDVPPALTKPHLLSRTYRAALTEPHLL